MTVQEEVLAPLREMHDRIDPLPQVGWKVGGEWLREQEPEIWKAILLAEADASVAAVSFMQGRCSWDVYLNLVGAAEIAWRRAADHLNGMVKAGVL